jgi:hypothetical protein
MTDMDINPAEGVLENKTSIAELDELNSVFSMRWK